MINERLLLILLISIGVLFACNNNEEVVENSNSNPTTNNEVNTGNVNTTDDTNDNTLQAKDNEKYNFSDFSLDVDYPGNVSYELEYEYELRDNQRIVEASIEDERNKEYLRGEEAYSRMKPLLKQINFDASSSSDTILSEIISIFSISDDYTKIDVDITYGDGTKKEYTFKK